MNTRFQFRLNEVIIPQIKVRPVMLDGIVGHWELVTCDDKLGEFAIDDNEELADPALTRFILEMRDAMVPPIERRYLPNKGWQLVTTRGCLSLLESAGVIETHVGLRKEAPHSGTELRPQYLSKAGLAGHEDRWEAAGVVASKQLFKESRSASRR